MDDFPTRIPELLESLTARLRALTVDRAARIAVDAVRAFLREPGHGLEEIVFCCFSDGDADVSAGPRPAVAPG